MAAVAKRGAQLPGPICSCDCRLIRSFEGLPLHLTSLRILQFRNIESLLWEPSPGVNLICGENGQGKTNVLEAIQLGLLGRSFRTRREEECLPWSRGDDPASRTILDVTFGKQVGSQNNRIILGANRKQVIRDETMLSRLAELWDGAWVVTFAPDDVDLFRDSPGRRRRFLDFALSQGSRLYMESLRNYQKALREVNAILKRRDWKASEKRAQAEAYYSLMGQNGAAIMNARADYLEALLVDCSGFYALLGGVGVLRLQYISNVQPPGRNEACAGGRITPEDLTSHFIRWHEECERLGAVITGPQRDDFQAFLNERDLATYGSQGQHRLAALALKLGTALQIEKKVNDAPILLLDDFGSELDVERRTAVLRSVHGRMQVFITATQVADLGPANLFDEVREIRAGRLVERS